MGRTEADRKITSEPWSSMQRSNKEQGRPLFGVDGEVCAKKYLTGPTLLEMSGKLTNRDLTDFCGKCEHLIHA